MDLKEFSERCQEMIDYIADYFESLSQRLITQNMSSEHLRSIFPRSLPETGESFEKIMEDIENYIMPGITHWQHPGFYAYIPCATSFPSILASMLTDILGHVGFNWEISPSGSELEVIMVDWYGKMIGLPNSFLYGTSNRGAGILQGSSCECIFITMVTARQNILRKLGHKNPSISYAALLSPLVVYCSKESHNCIEKIALVTLVNVRILETDENYRLRGETLCRAIENDKKIGLIPFFVNVTLGTRSCASCDPVKEIGPVCKKCDIWMNIDAGYVGTAMACPEYRHFLEGIEYASSFIASPALWMLVNLDCSIVFVKDLYKIKESVLIDRTVFGYSFAEKDWGYPCKIEFRALKLFFVMNSYGIEGIQRHVRNHIHLADLFADFVKNDRRFELITKEFGIVCFRLKGSDFTNKLLNHYINTSGKLYMSPCCLGERYVLRFVICREGANEDDIKSAWEIICQLSETAMKGCPPEVKLSSSKIVDELFKYCIP